LEEIIPSKRFYTFKLPNKGKTSQVGNGVVNNGIVNNLQLTFKHHTTQYNDITNYYSEDQLISK
jgi:hypothetical protein